MDVSINEILSEPIKKLTECGFYKVLQTKYPDEEKQQSIIATLFRIYLNQKKSPPYHIIDKATNYYNFCSNIGLIDFLEKDKKKTGLEIATLLNDFSIDKSILEILLNSFGEEDLEKIFSDYHILLLIDSIDEYEKSNQQKYDFGYVNCHFCAIFYSTGHH